MNKNDKYQELLIPKSRKLIVESLNYGLKLHYIKGLVEFDVTEARNYLKKYKEETGKSLSFTSWVVKCIAQAVSEYKEVHALKKGRKFIIFNDIDICVLVERIIEGKKYPVNYIVRNAQDKSFREINDEIRHFQTKTEDDIMQQSNSKKTKLFLKLPKLLRHLLFWRKLKNDPFFKKQNLGTVNVTAIGMFGNGRGWPISIPISGLSIAIGGISTQPSVINNEIEIRELLCMTVMFDHDIVDGAPATRFITRLKELIESGFGLKE